MSARGQTVSVPHAQRPDRRRLASIPKGTRVIEACEQAGSYVPRYCYHKKLTSPGNCRMCLIEMGMPKMGPDRKPVLGADGKPVINWMPRPQISCAQDVAEGMGVRTDSPLVEECRRGRDGISAHQSSARLPDLRSGGRMPAAGIQRRVRQRRFALSRKQSEEAEERRARSARDAGRRALHSLLALHPFLQGDRERRRPRLRRSRQLTPCSPRIRASGSKTIIRSTPSTSVRSAR